LENLLTGSARREGGKTHVETPLGAFITTEEHEGEVTVLIRPNAARLDSTSGITLKAELLERSFRGSICRAVFDCRGWRLTFEFLSDVQLPEPGETVDLSLDPSTSLQVLQ
jgi:hypothetical protein